ncbi:hypothetical protein IED13_09645 [Bosea sp. SSUT16]|uniref:Uncharacterized protein n=1 Tax=Bosea spartocytisi TaxID=2773451 RepID=A0A927E9Q9_9HYPH|nr:hypothetical protein [Bosea spartocytisi]MBD3845960.1 hypothetical protein [Bosea spartocytisi]MCT4473144.1 hypothetical protein [Bosea spartocytisi]
MSAVPMSFDEIAARLRCAARNETFCLNHLELLVAKAPGEDPRLRELTIGETLRQAAALAKASEIALALARNPEIAIGLGLLPPAEALS